MEPSENRIAVLSIIVEDLSQSAAVNELLHTYNQYVLGRMGIPCRERGISVMSVILDAPNPALSGLSGKLGRLSGVQAKVQYTK